MVLSQYTWIFGLSCVVSFICAFGIGANDVANSFASSVGAKALTMPQAILVAAVCEFSGAVLMGSGVTDTIKGSIASLATFKRTPDLFLYGFFCVMLAAAFWDNLSCHLSFPVSTTHTTVGAIVGTTLAIGGKSAVHWFGRKAAFPYVNGLAPILLSWVISPVMAGAFVTLFFLPLRAGVLRSPHAFSRSLYVLPVCVLITFFVISIFIVQTGASNGQWRVAHDGVAAAVAAGVAVLAGGGAAALSWLHIKPSVIAADERAQAYVASMRVSPPHRVRKGSPSPPAPGSPAARAAAAAAAFDLEAANYTEPSRLGARLNAAWSNFCATRAGELLTNNWVSRTLSFGANYKVHDHLQTDERVAELWADAEVFDAKAERVFRYLQVFTACTMSFAHGSNDVSNAMGPFAAVYQTWSTGATPSESTPVPLWILAIGGAGIVSGLATYGYKIMAVLAVKSVKLTNSRGFCVELATSATVVLASRFQLPVSTTQVICGAVLAMGLMEGSRGVNWRMAARIVIGWVLTLVTAGSVAALLTAFGVYTPNKAASLAAAAAASGRRLLGLA